MEEMTYDAFEEFAEVSDRPADTDLWVGDFRLAAVKYEASVGIKAKCPWDACLRGGKAYVRSPAVEHRGKIVRLEVPATSPFKDVGDGSVDVTVHSVDADGKTLGKYGACVVQRGALTLSGVISVWDVAARSGVCEALAAGIVDARWCDEVFSDGVTWRWLFESMTRFAVAMRETRRYEVPASIRNAVYNFRSSIIPTFTLFGKSSQTFVIHDIKIDDMRPIGDQHLQFGQLDALTHRSFRCGKETDGLGEWFVPIRRTDGRGRER